MDPVKKRQSETSKSGKEFEEEVKKSLEYKLNKRNLTDIKVITQSEVEKLNRIASKKGNQEEETGDDTKEELYKNLYKAITIEVFHKSKDKRNFYRMPGDTDIIVYSEELQYPIVIISCKLSLHGRLTESLFYALYYRIFRKIRYVLVTVDKGRQAGKKYDNEKNGQAEHYTGKLDDEVTQNINEENKGNLDNEEETDSEWGRPDKPNKNRLLAKLFLDGVYIAMGENFERFHPRNKKSNKTALGDIVKDFDQIVDDIEIWYREMKGYEERELRTTNQ